MIILNGLTKAGTCESVTAMSENGLVIIAVEFEDKAMLNVKNNISKETSSSHMIGIIDAGIQYSFQAYNNRIKIAREDNKPYRGRD